MVLEVLEVRGFAVESKLQLGPTNIVRSAVLAGQIDIYPEYTGNGALFFHMEGDPAWKDWARGYDLVATLCGAKNHLVWLTPPPANNTWTIPLRKDLAGRHRLAPMDDFSKFVA